MDCALGPSVEEALTSQVFCYFYPRSRILHPRPVPRKDKHVVGECAEQGEPWDGSSSWEDDGGGSHLAEGRALWVSQWRSVEAWSHGDVVKCWKVR